MASSSENQLYGLTQANAGVEARHLLKLADAKYEQLKRDVNEFVHDAFVKEPNLEGVRATFEVLHQEADEDDRRVVGAIGFALLAQSVDRHVHRRRSTADNKEAEAAEAKRLTCVLRIAAVGAYLRDWYEPDESKKIHELNLGDASIHQFGTTSFIVQAPELRTSEVRALKCLLPRYTQSPFIGKETEGYSARMAGVLHTPTVLDSGERWIVMEWAAGKPLAESGMLPKLRQREEAIGLIKTAAEFAALEAFALAVADVLHDIHESDHSDVRAHLDLSPMNILGLAPDCATDVQLVDFGINFLVEERVGSPQAFSGATLYMAPEIKDRSFPAQPTAEDKLRADLYSLGMILLQIIACGNLTEGNKVTHLRTLWESAPGWARLIEDLAAPKADKRLCLLPPGAKPYRYVRRMIEQERKMIGLFGVGAKEGEAVGAPTRFRWWAARSFNVPARLLQASRETPDELDASPGGYTGLAYWSMICLGLWVGSAALFLMFFSADLGASNALTNVISFGLPDSLHRYEIGPAGDHYWATFWQNIPGRLVAITFGMCAAAYYMNIFATLSLAGLPKERWAERSMRACAFFPWIPILVALVFNPHWWPYMSGVGCIVVILNNRLMLGVAERAAKADAPLDDEFLKYYGEWWRLMLTLCLFLFATGALVDLGWVPDTWFLAVAVAIGVNYLKLYRSNSYRFAPRVRGNLQRAIFVLRRDAAMRGQTPQYDHVAAILERPSQISLVSGSDTVQIPTEAREALLLAFVKQTAAQPPPKTPDAEATESKPSPRVTRLTRASTLVRRCFEPLYTGVLSLIAAATGGAVAYSHDAWLAGAVFALVLVVSVALLHWPSGTDSEKPPDAHADPQPAREAS